MKFRTFGGRFVLIAVLWNTTKYDGTYFLIYMYVIDLTCQKGTKYHFRPLK